MGHQLIQCSLSHTACLINSSHTHSCRCTHPIYLLASQLYFQSCSPLYNLLHRGQLSLTISTQGYIGILLYLNLKATLQCTGFQNSRLHSLLRMCSKCTCLHIGISQRLMGQTSNMNLLNLSSLAHMNLRKNSKFTHLCSNLCYSHSLLDSKSILGCTRILSNSTTMFAHSNL